MKKFAFLFPIGGRIEWSQETANSLANRLADDTEDTRRMVMEFGERSKPGEFIKWPTGEFLVCTKDGTFDTSQHE